MGIEKKILDSINANTEAIANLTEAMKNGFSSINSRIESIERRQDRQEQQARRTSSQQGLHAEKIDKLQSIVLRLAEDEPVRTWADRTAILKEDAYPEFERQGVSARKAMKALRRSGTIQSDNFGKNTVNIHLNGSCQRVIIVNNHSGKERIEEP